MSPFLIIFGYLLSFVGIVFGPHYFHKYVNSVHDAKAVGLLCMLPGVFLLCLGFYLR